MLAADERARPVAILGGGSIGVAWAIVFVRAGVEARIFEPDADRRDHILPELRSKAEDLEDHGLFEGSSSMAGHVVVTGDLSSAVEGVAHVQECAPEALELKRSLFEQVDDVVDPTVTIASSSSAMTCSQLAAGLAGRARCMIAHPANPPYLLPVVEVAPAPFTAAENVRRVGDLLTRCGMYPIVIHEEIEGLVFNRLQGALLREAYCLVRDGVIGPAELDRLVTMGLGRRWSVIGPFATAELNTRGGIERHARLLGPAYERMGAERGQQDPWTPELVHRVAEAIHAVLPPERWEENVRDRDEALMMLSALWGDLERRRGDRTS